MTPEQAFSNLYNIVAGLRLSAPEHFQIKGAFEETGKVIFKKAEPEQPPQEG